MAGVIATIPKFQFSANGVPMVGGTLDTYIAGSTTPATTWQDSALTIANTNPISLDARGECVLWLDPAVVYKFVLKNSPSNGGVVQWTQDNISNPAALSNALRTDLAAASGADLLGYKQAAAGAVARTVQGKLRDTISVFDFMTTTQIADVLAKTYGVDVTASINAAISAASSLGQTLLVPAGGYRIVPATSNTDEAGSNLSALTMVSNMHLLADEGAVFKIADNVSTDAAPIRMSMFFSNQVLSSISIVGLTMDMNGANNKISPSRGSNVYNNFTNAHIIISGTPGGVAAKASDVLIDRCRMINGAGVSCIVMGQTNTIGADFGTRWTVSRNVFYNNGLDCNDHSSVYAWALDVDAWGNTFENPAPSGLGNQPGGKCAYEIHCSNARFFNNVIKNYTQGLWISQNNTEGAVRNVNIYGNSARVSATFTDFYASNLVFPWYLSESPHEHVNIFGNTVEMTGDAVDEQVKAFFKIAARKQPKIVNIYGNTCRSYETTKEVALCLYVVGSNQLLEGTNINVHDNTGAGLTIGLDVYFGGTGDSLGLGSLSFKNNDLGVLRTSPINSGIHDVYLYGPSAGKVDRLVLGGLQTVLQPVLTDGAAAGRANVYGSVVLDLPVTWNGVTLGNGSATKKISIDTDAGNAVVSLALLPGSTTTAAGNIYPTITGLAADANGAATGLVKYGATPYVLAGEIDATASYFQLFTNAGMLSSGVPAAFTPSTAIYVNANFPCRVANI